MKNEYSKVISGRVGDCINRCFERVTGYIWRCDRSSKLSLFLEEDSLCFISCATLDRHLQTLEHEYKQPFLLYCYCMRKKKWRRSKRHKNYNFNIRIYLVNKYLKYEKRSRWMAGCRHDPNEWPPVVIIIITLEEGLFQSSRKRISRRKMKGRSHKHYTGLFCCTQCAAHPGTTLSPPQTMNANLKNNQLRKSKNIQIYT